MNEIICPHCKKAFKIDEAGFADILKQVRDDQFEKELHDRLALAEKEQEAAVKLAEANIKNSTQTELAEKEAEIADMKADIERAELEKKLAVTEAVNKIEKERDELAGELKSKDTEKQLLETSLKEKYTADLKAKDDIIKLQNEKAAQIKTH